ncbi:hypothetical protein GQ600_4571 [Phytophthora cactorum]|nr:hypothetical protein GQ600_4571 [Phytophthora cactorum]
MGGSEHNQAEGMILSLIDQGVPDTQIRAIFGVGDSMIAGLKAVTNSGSTLCTLVDLQLDPATHIQMTIFIFLSTTVTIESGVTWKCIWERYQLKAETRSRRIIEYSRWLQYVHQYFPGVRLSRSKGYLCDACVRIEMSLLNPSFSESDRAELVAEKSLHLSAAINQRRAMSTFVKQYAAKIAPQQSIPSEIIADHGEMPLTLEPVVHNTIPLTQIQIEDLVVVSLPVYNNKKPSADYFNSNLMMHNFIIADITDGYLLAATTIIEVDVKKLKSLSLKYFSIPAEFSAYYPADSEPSNEISVDTTDSTTVMKRKLAVGVQGPVKRPVVRPRKGTSLQASTRRYCVFSSLLQPRESTGHGDVSETQIQSTIKQVTETSNNEAEVGVSAMAGDGEIQGRPPLGTFRERRIRDTKPIVTTVSVLSATPPRSPQPWCTVSYIVAPYSSLRRPTRGRSYASGLRRPARPVRGHVIGVVLHRLAQVPSLSTLRSTARSARGYSLRAEHYVVPDVCVLEARALHRYTDCLRVQPSTPVQGQALSTQRRAARDGGDVTRPRLSYTVSFCLSHMALMKPKTRCFWRIAQATWRDH